MVDEKNAKSNEKRAEAKDTRNAVKKLATNIQKTTLGDLDSLTNLKDEMTKSEAAADKKAADKKKADEEESAPSEE
jgi:hypothetical protein